MFCGIYFLKMGDQTNILRITGLTCQITCSKEVKQNEIKKKRNKQTNKTKKKPSRFDNIQAFGIHTDPLNHL